MLEGEALDRFMERFWDESKEAQVQSGGTAMVEEDQKDGRITQDLDRVEKKSIFEKTGWFRKKAETATAEDELEEYGLKEDGVYITPVHWGRVEKRTWFSLTVMLLTVPFMLYMSVVLFHGKQYLAMSLIIVFFAMVPFFLVFEGRKPQAREIMVIAVLAAIGVAGRAAFYMVPSFKPIAAIVIITGVSFGGEAGFLVGCMIMMVSNMFFGQGPWTPWQMFSYGLIGFLAGILFQKGILKAKKIPLCIYGFLSVIFIFGGIMNPASILMSYGRITWKSLIAFYISGIPVDLVQATSTVFFLWILSRPLLEKLERIKKKYGLIER